MNKESIDGMLKDLMYDIDLGAVRHSTADFIKSLNETFRKYGKLSERQEASLRKTYREHMGSSF